MGMELRSNIFWVVCTISTLTVLHVSTNGQVTAMDDESWNLDLLYRRHITDDVIVASSDGDGVRNDKEISWIGRKKCSPTPPSIKDPKVLSEDLLPELSACPWYYVLNYDVNRTPTTLLAARCACASCQVKDNIGHRCVPVIYYRHVTYYKGTDQEQRRLFPLPVGCTCERPTKTKG